MSNDTAQKVIDDLLPIFIATETSLNEWTGDGNLPFPTLLELVAVKLNWDEKQVRRNDPFVREYVRQNNDWCVTRGAGGGIMRAAEKHKKDAVKQSKELAKKHIESVIEAKSAAAIANVKTQPSDETL